ncbi:hypothetical protein BU17DRAFT_85339 [Hysterangium stoloniferum]|nr:hypothetical protein BU17DRAFT_85339 [Hysterangium stoloniferum]
MNHGENVNRSFTIHLIDIYISEQIAKDPNSTHAEMGRGQIAEDPNSSHADHLDTICKGFDILALAATFMCAIQSQVLSTTLSGLPDTTAVRATNTFYLSGLTLDFCSACLACLSSRWFQRLTNAEKKYLQAVFSTRARIQSQRAALDHGPQTKQSLERGEGDSLEYTQWSLSERILISWYSMSLFVPMGFLILGTVCMVVGLYIYVWSQHPLPVSITVSLAGIVTLPFIIGVFSIGRADERRRTVIRRLSRMQGDW